MNNIYLKFVSLFIVITLLHRIAPIPLKYPKTEKSKNVIDIYHGDSIVDEYRWLEDDNSKQTKAWVQKQNAFTDRYMRKIPFRKKIKDRLTELWDYPTLSMPFMKNNHIYFYKNDGLQNQSVLYVKKNIYDPDSIASVVIDPNAFSSDGTESLGGIYFSNDNKYLGYSVQKSGSDWREFYIQDLNTGLNLNDHIKWVKFSGWSGLGGQTKNPYVLDRNPCGSSSGSAVAVSANLCAAAIGTETWGSIMCPSNANGIVGIKPTVGLWSRSGIIPISYTQDTAGPMTRTVEDAAILLGVATGIDMNDIKTIKSKNKYLEDYTKYLNPNGLEGKRIGYVKTVEGKNHRVDILIKKALNDLRDRKSVV